ncbi:MAG: hypothetical protein ACRC1K_22705, partial [Planctomycetia bacterium]
MPAAFLYGHRAGGARTGYQIVAASASAPLFDDAVRRLEALRVRAEAVAKEVGWCWLPLVNDRSWLFARFSSHEEDGRRTLLVRGLVFDAPEAAPLDGRPFLFADWMNDDARWTPDAAGKLPTPEPPPLPEDRSLDGADRPAELVLPWAGFADGAARFVQAQLNVLTPKARRGFRFAFPVATVQRDLDWQFVDGPGPYTLQKPSRGPLPTVRA